MIVHRGQKVLVLLPYGGEPWVGIISRVYNPELKVTRSDGCNLYVNTKTRGVQVVPIPKGATRAQVGALKGVLKQ